VDGLCLCLCGAGELTHEEMIMELASRAKAERSATPPRDARKPKTTTAQKGGTGQAKR
jgi:hypothetical protein